MRKVQEVCTSSNVTHYGQNRAEQRILARPLIYRSVLLSVRCTTLLLDAFAKLRKATIKLRHEALSIRPQ